MIELYYIEDIFLEFMKIANTNGVHIQHYDRSAAYSFFDNINKGNVLTENQGKYILKILFKYRNVMKPYFDYEDKLENPIWKNPFRIVDNTKSIWLENDETNMFWICMKFSYQFKETFDEEFTYSRDHRGKNVWDNERKIRKLKFYEYNPIQIYEFAKTNGFEISDNFMEAINTVEEIWQNAEEIEPRSEVSNNEVTLVNATEDAVKYFDENKNGNIGNDLFLAKSMGYHFKQTSKTTIEKIASSTNNTFWIKSQKEFVELAYQLNGKIAIILDRTEEILPWIKNLASILDECGYDKSDFRVCFRASNKDDPEFNTWVNKNKFGGKIDTAKFLIFQYKAAKWLFNKENDVIIIASNELMPSTNTQTRAMFQTHPCVVYIGEYKPTKKEDNIIEL